MQEPTTREMVDHLNEHIGEHQQILVHLVHKLDELEANLAAVVEQLAMVSMNQFLQFVDQTEGGEYVEDAEIHNWGMAFVSKIDTEVQKPGNEEIKNLWMEGEWCDELVDFLKVLDSKITEEQLDWLEEFTSEI